MDAATRAIALNNQLSVNLRENPFENHRLHEAAIHNFSSSKPFLAQSQPFSFNNLLVSSQAHKSVKHGIKRHLEEFPLDYSVSLVRLFDLLPDPSDTNFVDKLASEFHHDETDVGSAFLLIQAHMQTGNLAMAISTLEKCLHAVKDLNVKYAPGFVSLALLLFQKAAKEEKASALLTAAKTYWTSQKTLVIVFRQLTDFRILRRLH